MVLGVKKDVLPSQTGIVVGPVLSVDVRLVFSLLVIPVLEVVINSCSMGSIVLVHHGAEAALRLCRVTVQDVVERIPLRLVPGQQLGTRHGEMLRARLCSEKKGVIRKTNLFDASQERRPS